MNVNRKLQMPLDSTSTHYRIGSQVQWKLGSIIIHNKFIRESTESECK